MDEKTKKKKDAVEIITEDVIAEAYQRMQEYFKGKKSVDQKATANQEWWRGRHWSEIMQENKSLEDDKKPASAWLFNSIINKHADIMDNFPKPNVLPRDADDQQDAESLTKIVPVVLEQNGYEEVYTRKSYDYIGDGTAITGVFWDSNKNDGLGDIAITQVDIHNIAWKPGIQNIQDSPEVFTIAPVSNEELVKMYPQMEGHTGQDFTKVEYQHDDTIDTSDTSFIVDWYYKVQDYEDVQMDDEGKQFFRRPKTVLHYCKFCNGQILYSSENDGMDKGFYEHGKFPFVFQVMFPIKDSPVGFGYIDVMKDPQTYIDVLDQLITKNTMMTGNLRYFVREDSGFDPKEFADVSNPFVHYAGGNIDEMLQPINVPSIPAYVIQHQTNKIEELKETSGNRDFSQGSTQSGVTAASAIAALQEAGSKLSRDLIRGAYRAFQDECYFVIELIRQFYTEPRSFRIDDGKGGYDFIDYDNSNISNNPTAIGLEERDPSERRRPVFDIKITAEKQSPFSRAAQNEVAKELYSMGMFNPDMAEPALVCLDMMDFEGIDQIKEKVQNNSVLMQQFQRMVETIQMFDASYPQFGLAQTAGVPGLGMGMNGAPQMGGAQPMPMAGGGGEGTPEERASRAETDSTLVAKARRKAASQAVPD